MITIDIIVRNEIDRTIHTLRVPTTSTGYDIIKLIVGDVHPDGCQLFIITKFNRDPLLVGNRMLSEIEAQNGDTFFLTYDPPLRGNSSKIQLSDFREDMASILPSLPPKRESIERDEHRSAPKTESTTRSVLSFNKSDDPFDKIKSQLKDAFRKFDFPKTMKVGIPYDVKLEILRNAEEVMEKLRHELKMISVTDMVKVSLKGEDFTITPYYNSEKQFIPDTGSAEWNWKVTPQKRGTKILIVQISTTLKHETFGLVDRDFPLYEEQVLVTINPSYSLKEWLKKNWQWIIGTILGTGIVWKVVESLLGKKT